MEATQFPKMTVERGLRFVVQRHHPNTALFLLQFARDLRSGYRRRSLSIEQDLRVEDLISTHQRGSQLNFVFLPAFRRQVLDASSHYFEDTSLPVKLLPHFL